MKTIAARRRHPAALLILLLFALTVLGIMYAGINSAASADDAVIAPAPGTDTASQIEAGRNLFIEGCSSCHGIGAQGTNQAPTLIGAGAAAADFQLSTGRMPLAAQGVQAPSRDPQYSDEQIAQISAFIGSLAPGPAIPSAAELDYEKADLPLGGELFRTNCTQCHNFAGAGGALSDGAFAPSIRNATIKEIYEAMLTGPEQMPVFSDRSLTAEDKQAIIKYIKTMDAAPNVGGWALGNIGPVSEGVAAWLIGILGLIVMSIWLGARVR